MTASINPLLLVTFSPLIGVLIILLLGKRYKESARWVALATSLVYD